MSDVNFYVWWDGTAPQVYNVAIANAACPACGHVETVDQASHDGANVWAPVVYGWELIE